jgi:hypothetical protein
VCGEKDRREERNSFARLRTPVISLPLEEEGKEVLKDHVAFLICLYLLFFIM